MKKILLTLALMGMAGSAYAANFCDGNMSNTCCQTCLQTKANQQLACPDATQDFTAWQTCDNKVSQDYQICEQTCESESQ